MLERQPRDLKPGRRAQGAKQILAGCVFLDVRSERICILPAQSAVLIRIREVKERGKSMNDTNAFLGRTTRPTEEEVASALGVAAPAWNELLNWLKEEEKLSEREWNSSSPKYGWALRVKQKKRNIVYLAPCNGCFRVSFILGDKAVAAARERKLPKVVLKALDQAPRYPEGTGLRLLVSKSKDLPPIRTLTEVKLAS